MQLGDVWGIPLKSLKIPEPRHHKHPHTSAYIIPSHALQRWQLQSGSFLLLRLPASFVTALKNCFTVICTYVSTGHNIFDTFGIFYHRFPSRPNVCVEREVTLVAQRQPCVQAFTRMVKVWKQGCIGQSWCMGYERRWVMHLSPPPICLISSVKASDCLYRHSRFHLQGMSCCAGWSEALINGSVLSPWVMQPEEFIREGTILH